ncbi:MAG: hypothetical protein IPM92_12700 [Saprospiraceae bacterium]|nr:hypothetical protein [Saprospiraceae bacterium]
MGVESGMSVGVGVSVWEFGMGVSVCVSVCVGIRHWCECGWVCVLQD